MWSRARSSGPSKCAQLVGPPLEPDHIYALLRRSRRLAIGRTVVCKHLTNKSDDALSVVTRYFASVRSSARSSPRIEEGPAPVGRGNAQANGAIQGAGRKIRVPVCLC